MDKEKQKVIHERVMLAATNSRLSCNEAFAIAAEIECSVEEVGRVCNEIAVKIVQCQLGCF
ncbi:MAG TPA: hypothetical protein VLH18_02100 [Candidatus Limnocylindrales bacterium]|nr:hypothetical protein [Candidatus Limnocylindrales bacterium]